MDNAGVGYHSYQDPNDWKTEEEKEEETNTNSAKTEGDSSGCFLFCIAFCILFGFWAYDIIKFWLTQN